MSYQKMYFKQNVIAEPLFNEWYAWSYLIAPATAAMYVANSHLKIMQSFVSAPQVHIAALKNPKMLGGPFINYDAGRVKEIATLLEKTIKHQAPLIELAGDIKAVQALINEADGYSLEPLYQKIPDGLKGFVELVYNLNNNPSVRFIEGLLYKSRYYNKSSQSIALSVIDRDNRPFALSTPRLGTDHVLKLDIAFESKVLDELFQMRNTPNLVGNIQEKLNIPPKSENLFLSFFTEEVPPEQTSYTGDAVRIRYFGHACVLIEAGGTSILCDPVISYNYNAEFIRYTFADLPPTIDYILITHNHQDHCMIETLLQLRHKTKNIILPKSNPGELIDPSLKLVLQNIGFKVVKEIDIIETIDFNGGFLQGLPFLGEHADLNIMTKIAYHIRIQNKSILVAADSNNLEPKIYEYISQILGNDIDVLFLGMECDGAPLSWLYSPLLTQLLPRKMDQSRRLDGSDYERAIGIVKQLYPKQVYVYAMGQEPWLSFMMSTQYTEASPPIIESNKLIEDCQTRGIIAERLFGKKEILLN